MKNNTKNTFLLPFLLTLFSLLVLCSCSAQEETTEDLILEEINISDCNCSKEGNIVKSDFKFLSSTQIFDSRNKQGVVSVFYQVEYDGYNFNINFITESNIFDNYLGLESADLRKFELDVKLYFEGISDAVVLTVKNVDLIISADFIKNDTFIGFSFNAVNIDSSIVYLLKTRKLIKFDIHEDTFGVYSSYRKDISKEIKCVIYTKTR